MNRHLRARLWAISRRVDFVGAAVFVAGCIVAPVAAWFIR